MRKKLNKIIIKRESSKENNWGNTKLNIKQKSNFSPMNNQSKRHTKPNKNHKSQQGKIDCGHLFYRWTEHISVTTQIQ